MQSFEVKIKLHHEILINLHKSIVEAAEDMKQQAAIQIYHSVLRHCQNYVINGRENK
ncbi:Uncharacterized protein dnl_56660 [Desulfonema limicola]|uniref:Uncharacterized protein n=1 Tax=Desulfonema limicola TaxID=45656 RepID=A0A975BDI4_9BACT|nr:Uncharacterized protein dnl_56660 [Desulfonema limicola]